MNSRSLILVALILFSILVLIFYVQPRIDTLRAKETSLAELRTTVSQTTELNSLLESHLAKINSLRADDLQKIEQFLPQKINSVLVARDIATVAETNNLALESVTVGDPLDSTARNGQLDDGLTDTSAVSYRVNTTSMSFEMQGEYQNIKQFLEQLEVNSYPIKITEMTLAPRATDSESGEAVTVSGYTLGFTIELYSFSLVN